MRVEIACVFPSLSNELGKNQSYHTDIIIWLTAVIILVHNDIFKTNLICSIWMIVIETVVDSVCGCGVFGNTMKSKNSIDLIWFHNAIQTTGNEIVEYLLCLFSYFGVFNVLFWLLFPSGK